VVIFDAAFLLLTFDSKARIPPDPATGKVIAKGRERVEHLIETLSDARTRMLIPTPVIAEILVHAGSASNDYIAKLRRVSSMVVADFDMRAAVECAQLTSTAIGAGGKRGSASNQPWQKVKIDRQILAIAKVHQATTIYTCDGGLAKIASAEGLKVCHVADLPLPPLKSQAELFKDSDE
jgi:predicted nucleic acid-binding protein